MEEELHRTRRLGQSEMVLDVPADASLDDVNAVVREIGLEKPVVGIHFADVGWKNRVHVSWREAALSKEDPLEWSDHDSEDFTAEEKANATECNDYDTDFK
jgi:hypothetical protein